MQTPEPLPPNPSDTSVKTTITKSRSWILPISGILLLLIVLGLGWYAWPTFFSKPPALSSEIRDGYLAIPELGVQFKVPESLSDLTYVAQNRPEGISVSFSTQSLSEQNPPNNGVQCKPEGAPLGSIVHGEPPVIAEVFFKSDTTRLESLAYYHPQEPCTGGSYPDVEALQSALLTTFQEMLRTTEPIPRPRLSETVISREQDYTEIENGERILLDTYMEKVRVDRDPVVIESWTAPNGHTVTLYSKDRIELYRGDTLVASADEYELIAKDPSGFERVLLADTPNNPYLGGMNIAFAEFSPKGTHFSIRLAGYEGYSTATYELGTGASIFAGYGYQYAVTWPYWNDDETKLALLRGSRPIDGITAALYWSRTGRIEDAVLIRDFRRGIPDAQEPQLDNADMIAGKLHFDLFESDDTYSYSREEQTSHGNAEAFEFDLETGQLTSYGMQVR